MARNDKPDRSAAEEAELARRLKALDQQLEQERGVEQRSEAAGGASGSFPAAAGAFRLATDFLAGVALGVALGWGFDRLFGTSPWGLLVWSLLGFVAGTLNVMRSAGLVKPGPLGQGPDDRLGRG
jgi:ATP synthase protein I